VPYSVWRRVHRTASYLVALISLVHIGVTFVMYDEWSPDAVWFVGTGVGLLCMAVVNIAHVGLEPCLQPTAPVVRRLNWLLVGLGVAAVVAVPQPQAYAILLGLIAQAAAGHATLAGPSD
jgi:hypothetical protein